MKEPVSSFAQLTAVIMMLVAIAIGTAAMFQWMGSSVAEDSISIEKSNETLFASGQTR
jgi:hypothetical protein